IHSIQGLFVLERPAFPSVFVALFSFRGASYLIQNGLSDLLKPSISFRNHQMQYSLLVHPDHQTFLNTPAASVEVHRDSIRSLPAPDVCSDTHPTPPGE